MKIVNELRLLICGWCMGLMLWVVPKDSPEGIIIIKSIKRWATDWTAHARIRTNNHQDKDGRVNLVEVKAKGGNNIGGRNEQTNY